MPKIVRWFPVSHDINSDHELWEMTDKLGDRSLRVWLEILSIGDRNEGVIASWSDSLARSIGFKCHSNSTKVRQVWDHALKAKWLTPDKVARLANYSKYHKTRGTNRVPSEPSEPHTNQTKPKHIKLNDVNFQRFWEAYPKKVGKAKAIQAWNKIALLKDQEKIFAALEAHKKLDQWQSENGRFIPHPATWLNQRRWEDELETKVGEPMKPPWVTLEERRRAKNNIR
jgi:hypothetical protein